MLEESPVYETIMPLLPTQTREQRIDDLAATTRDYARGASPRRWTRPCSTTTRSFCAPYGSRGARGQVHVNLYVAILTIRGWRSMGRM
ncbi:MAG: hypothetical protein ACLSAH_17295 [Bilophila wadsworthia]